MLIKDFGCFKYSDFPPPLPYPAPQPAALQPQVPYFPSKRYYLSSHALSVRTSTNKALYGFLYAYVDKSVRAWYEDGLMTFYTSN